MRSMDPLGMPEESEAVPGGENSLDADDQACLARIGSLRQESLQEPDNLPAILKFFASRNMEIDLQVLSGLRQITSKWTRPLHEMPGLPQMLAAHLSLSRDYQRDLDLEQRTRQLKRKDERRRGPLSPQSGFSSVDKPR